MQILRNGVVATYSGDGLRRTYQDSSKNVFTQIWAGTDYQREVQQLWQ